MIPISNFSGAGAVQPPPSWVDDFFDFSSVKRNAHRRSASDSIAFVQLAGEDCRNSNAGFDGLDDDQLMTMFPDDAGAPAASVAAAWSNPCSPNSDQNSNDDETASGRERKNEAGEGDCSVKSDADTAAPASSVLDPKRVKRILANRQSAQRSRVRKLQYISELERSVSTLQTEVSALSPRVAYFDHQRLILNVDNSALKQRIAALAQDKIFKDAHQEALRKEIERLRQVYHQQKMDNNATAPPPSSNPSNNNTGCTDRD